VGALPLLGAFGFKEFLKHKPDVSDDEMTTDYCGRHNWIVGSPRTVAARLEEVYRALGGFGCILLFCFDYAENPGSDAEAQAPEADRGANCGVS
jgi:alkanesulfonate monooxygenase SsuD/methylene tetrahydromethanopterin reductase-like flavin-dependent oxidoreductase (luciferase family)